MINLNLFRRIFKRLLCPRHFWSHSAIGVIAAFVSISAFADPSTNLSLEQLEERHEVLVDEAKVILLSQGNWQDAKKLLEEARDLKFVTQKGEYPVRSKEADFYYAWILCQTPSESEQGRKLLDKTLHYDLWPEEKLDKIKQQRANCGTDSSVEDFPSNDKFVLAVIQKGGKWSKTIKLRSRDLLPVQDWSERKTAKAAIKDLFDNTYNLIEAQPFLVAGPFPKSYLNELADTVLLPYFNYITKSLGLEYDWGTIFVFVAGDHAQFFKTTEKLYNIDQDDEIAAQMAIAFSDLENNTMLAICGKNASNCTSFAHEIFHLINSRVFEDSPWWLYEGSAELFESGDVRDGVFHARAGWRKKDALINKLDSKSFLELLNISKNDPMINNPPGSAVAMSRVRFFCRYLYEKDALWTIYNELRKQDWRIATADPGGLDVIMKVLEKTSVDAVLADFREWFEQVVIPEHDTPGP